MGTRRRVGVALAFLLCGLVAPFPRRALAASPLVPPQLLQQAQSAGSVRVIIRLAIDTRPEGELSQAVVLAQRADIAALRRTVRETLQGHFHRIAYEYETVPLLAVEVGPDALAALEALPGSVAQVQEDVRSLPTLPESGPLVEAPQAWTAGFDGTGTFVAVLDTGVDKTHPFLAGKVGEEACFSSNDPSSSASSLCPGGVSSSTASGSGVPCTVSGAPCFHGTHVAGIAAGNGAGAGVSFSGIARGARLMSVQVFTRFDDPDFCGAGSTPCIASYSSDLIAGLERVYALRSTHVFAAVNMSLGGSFLYPSNCDGDARKLIIDNLRSVGIATVISSGNAGAKTALSAPACISSAVSVGSTGDGSGGTVVDAISSFSNVASFLSLLAPGMAILSSIPGGSYATFGGTSMAAPHVAGAFAILRQATPAGSVGDLLGALQSTGSPITDTRAGAPGNITRPRIRIADALGHRVFSDNFDTCTSVGGLGPNWTVDGAWSCKAGRARGEGGRGLALAKTATLQTTDVQALVQLNTSDGSGVVARAQAGTYYAARLRSSGHIQIVRVSSGVETVLADVARTIALNTSYLLRLRVSGTSTVSLVVDFRGATVLSADDSSASRLTSGLAGLLHAGGLRTQFDNFEATESGAAPPPPPPPPVPVPVSFSDNFNACTSTTNLGSHWDVSGRWYCRSLRARGETAAGTALATTAAMTDTDVSSLVQLNGSTGSGVLARSAGGHAYAARLLLTGLVQIVRIDGTTVTVLANAARSVVANTSYAVRLQVSGSASVQLTASVNGVVVLAGADSSAGRLTSGRAGLLSGAAARTQYDSFVLTGTAAP